MDLTILEGILKLAGLFMALAAGIIASTLFKQAWKKEAMKAWRPLIFALIFFAVQEVLGALRAFGIYSTPYLTHIVPNIILGLLIAAVVMQIDVKKRGVK
ncbi:MAG TPA: hypothetical protein VJI46_00230 [Candidatus Nanoarchaeia archaeon]|nr:hypothetical protein [Candidatus Nanoarchaeia archaeon]